MRLAVLTCLALVALGANSVLIRLAVVRYDADPAAFAVLRVASGALALGALMAITGRHWPRFGRRRWAGSAMLAAYMIGFSMAYRTLDAGLGALILFGTVQITVFAVVVGRGDRVSGQRWIGAALAFGGLVVLLRPGRAIAHIAWGDAALMALAGIAWGVYTLLGRRDNDPVAATAANFLLALPLTLPLLVFDAGGLDGPALAPAILSGAVTSGLGYVLFYSVLPSLDATIAGIAQLSVPVLAAFGGLILIGEPVTLRLVVAGLLVLGGIGLSLVRARATQGKV
jgi:drug/metabolite transporter (DMT)-like permease